MHLIYFKQADVLHIVISDEPESRSFELSPNISVELNAKNEMIGLEILKASSVTTSHYPSTESLYIEVSPEPSVDSQEVSDRIVLDYDADGNLVGIDIE